jgi:hypothetical protein
MSENNRFDALIAMDQADRSDNANTGNASLAVVGGAIAYVGLPFASRSVAFADGLAQPVDDGCFAAHGRAVAATAGDRGAGCEDHRSTTCH